MIFYKARSSRLKVGCELEDVRRMLSNLCKCYCIELPLRVLRSRLRGSDLHHCTFVQVPKVVSEESQKHFIQAQLAVQATTSCEGLCWRRKRKRPRLHHDDEQ